MIIILFGLAAAGKNFVGEIIAEELNYKYFDADSWLTPKMKKFIQQKKLFTLDTLDQFTSIIIEKSKELSQKHQNLVISQALYRQKNRDTIINALADYHVKFVEVVAPYSIIEQRIIKRNNWISKDYAEEMKGFFQTMDGVFKIINTKGKQEIITQAREMFK